VLKPARPEVIEVTLPAPSGPGIPSQSMHEDYVTTRLKPIDYKMEA
jgi:hypothetical protein